MAVFHLGLKCFRVLQAICSHRAGQVCVCLLLGLHAGLLAWSALRQSPTYDESFHLPAGIRHLQEGRFDVDLGNTPLFSTLATIPVLLADPKTDWSHVKDTFTVGLDFLRANGSRSFWLITLGRWGCIPLSVLGGFVCYRWARELYGLPSAMIALVLWCSCPEVIAHGQLVTGDMAATSMGVAAFYLFWKWLHNPTFGRASGAGVALGLAELAKFLWVVLYILWPALWIAWRLSGGRRGVQRSWWADSRDLMTMAVLGVYLTNLGYLSDESFQPLASFHFGKRLLDRAAPIGNVGRLAGFFPVPFPQTYVNGIEEISYIHDACPSTYLCGERQAGGWWYFYPFAAMIKLPWGLIVLFALAFCLCPWIRGCSASWRSEVFLLAVIAALIWIVTSSRIQQNLRYLLPAIPFVLICTSKVGTLLAKDKLLAVVVVACLTWSVGSSLWIYPHSLSYFNDVAGGPRRGTNSSSIAISIGDKTYSI